MKITYKIMMAGMILPIWIVLRGVAKDLLEIEVPSVSGQDNKETKVSNDELTVQSEYQKLSVWGDGCRGCGRCQQIDPEHFEMSGRTARVILSTNLNSSKLKMAINNCPGQAIILE